MADGAQLPRRLEARTASEARARARHRKAFGAVSARCLPITGSLTEGFHRGCSNTKNNKTRCERNTRSEMCSRCELQAQAAVERATWLCL